MAIYMKFGKIDGNATEKGHEKWITLGSLQFGVGRGISTPTGSSANRESSLPSVSEVTVTREMDAASTSLFTEICGKAKGETVKIDLVATANNESVVYANYELENCLLSGYSVSSGGDRPSESLSLNFTKVQFKYQPHDASNKTGEPVTVSYNISTGEVG